MQRTAPVAPLLALLLLAGCPFEAVVDADGFVVDDDDAATDDDDAATDDDDAATDDDDAATDDDDAATDDDDTLFPDDDDTLFPDDDDTAPAACIDDGLEDNDLAGLATPLSAGLESGLVSCAGDEDWYTVDLAVGDELTVTVSLINAEGDIDLVVLSPSGTELGSSETTFDVESVGPLTATVAGPHRIRVFLYGDAGSVPGSPYDLQIEVTPYGGPSPTPTPTPGPTPTPTPSPTPTPPPTGAPFDCTLGDSWEPNDSDLSAPSVYPGTYTSLTSCGDPDFYALSVGAFSDVYVDLWFSHAEGDLDLGILDSWGYYVDTSTSETDNESASTYTDLWGDDFVIHVELYADGGPWVGVDYEMDVFVF
jgi:hypothetical protein